MKKKELMKLKRLNATEQILNMAAQKNRWGEDSYRAFLSASVENGILKVFGYLSRQIRTGIIAPEFIIFHDRVSFISYIIGTEKWSTAALLSCLQDGYYTNSRVYMSDQDANIIGDYLNAKITDFYSFLNYQRTIRTDERLAREKKITDKWDRVMQTVPAVPKDWERWVFRSGIANHFFFYNYSKKKRPETEGYCSRCRHDVTARNVKYNQIIKCPRCGQALTCKSTGKFKYIWSESETVYLLQSCTKENMVLREFEVSVVYQSESYRSPDIHCKELKRVIYDAQLDPSIYRFELYKQQSYRWVHDSEISQYYYYYSVPTKGTTYPRNLAVMNRRNLKKTGLRELLHFSNVSPEKYLNRLRSLPLLEQIVKANLIELAKDIVMKNKAIDYIEGGALTRCLKIDSSQLKRFRAMHGNADCLEWFQLEKEYKMNMSNELISWFVSNNITPDDLSFILDRMSLVQIQNYLTRQSSENKESPSQIIVTWRDYLEMAERLGMNTSDAIIYRAKKLRQRHAELIERIAAQGREKRSLELLEKYPLVNSVLESISGKYDYQDDDYIIKAPGSILDILEEGEALQHCVHTTEWYYERISNQESFILFLRQTKAPEKHYYTLEIEPDATVRQKRTEFDRQNSDIDKATSFLLKWQKIILERLSKEDMNLANISKQKRIQNLRELKNRKVRITYGDFKGQELAEILEKDILEQNKDTETAA